MVRMSSADQRCSLSAEDQNFLLGLARESIRFGLKRGKPIPVDLDVLPAELKVKRATFVTLHKDAALRGCIGCLEAARPLAEDIAANSYAAAFQDPRFPPVAADEVASLEIHLSLLTPAEPMSFRSEADLLRQLEPGRDGLILQEGHRRGTFLPAVWETLREPREFLRHLKLKAGLPVDYWSDTLKVSRYRTEMIPEAEGVHG